MFTQPKKDGKEARFLEDVVDRNKVVRDQIIEMPNTRIILDWITKFRFRAIMDSIDGCDNIRLHTYSKKYSTFSCTEGFFNTIHMQ